ncbi:MAG: LptF/LptG family permease [Ignavibacteriaceae bacterium]
MTLYKYILRNHFAPFVFSLITLICIFILQFMMKFADRLVGKGLDFWIIIKLIVFNLSWMVVLVVPMATLVATLMAFGNLSQNNEITILKSSGISLYRMMLAPFTASIVICYLLFLFNNDVLPDANHQAKVLMQDISRQKPTLSLEPGVFSQEVSNYAILVRSLNQKTNVLTGVTIYDYTNPTTINVVTAKKGLIFFSKDQTKLIMDLEDGEIHESNVANTNLYRKLVFSKHRIAMDADQFSFQQSSPGGSRGERELSTGAMRVIVDSLKQIKSSQQEIFKQETKKYLYADTSNVSPLKVANVTKSINSAMIYARALEKIKTAKNIIISNQKRVENTQSEISKYTVEIFKKYSLPAACIVFVLIGAPLGVMTKKGGFGVAASISLFFFVIYWAFLIGGEKLAERNIISSFAGMWAANILLGISGILLTYRTVKETVTLNFSWLKKLLPKHFRELEHKEEENIE